MRRSVSVLILATLVLTSCGTVRDSRLNPFNWFGRATSEPVSASGEVNPLIPARRASIFRKEQDSSYKGWQIGQVTNLEIERRPGGAVIRATGVADELGPFEVRLVKDEAASTEGTLTYAMRALQPRGGQGQPTARTVTVAIWVTDNDLAGINTIRVVAARNALASRR